jgi:transketolase
MTDDRNALIHTLQARANALRQDVIEMVYAGGSGHPGGALSAAEIVTVLYGHVLRVDPARPDWPDRDRFVLSKGHACPIVYAALAQRGYFAREHLWTLRHLGSILQGHPDMHKTPGLDMTSGSLGQGLSLGLGMALGARQTKRDYQVYVLLSEGELQEGMIWEAAMAASHYQVGNLMAIVDYNNLQVDGPVNQVMAVEPLADKWRAFGWQVLCVADGNDVAQLLNAFDARQALRAASQPCVLVCRTVKGKGVSFMENIMEWHASPISRTLRDQAIAELRAEAETLA